MIDIYFQGKNGQRCMELCEYLMGAVPTTNNDDVFLEPFVTENDLEIQILILSFNEKVYKQQLNISKYQV